MKKNILIIILCISFSGLHAQVRRNATPSSATDSSQAIASSAPQQVSRKKMIQELNLSRGQMIKLKAIREEMSQRQEAIENDKLLTEEERRSRLRALQMERMEKNSQVLSPEQVQKFRAYRQTKKLNDQQKTTE